MKLAPATQRHLGRALALAFLAAVTYFSVRHARSVDWPAVGRAVAATPLRVLALAGLLALASHAFYAAYDLLGRRYTRHRLGAGRVLRITFISYAFNLNMGSLVGGIGLRYRLYTQAGLGYRAITRVVTLGMVTNWFGYLVLAGTLFTVAPLPLPPQWGLDTGGLRALGLTLLAAGGLYVALCLGSSRRQFSVAGRRLALPRPPLVAWQLALSLAHWASMGGLVYVLLQGAVPYPTALGVLLVAAVAGVAAHVPAGLGVLEGVFVALLSHRVPAPTLLAALFVFRALFYVGPWLVATPLYVAAELRFRARPKAPAGPGSPQPHPPHSRTSPRQGR